MAVDGAGDLYIADTANYRVLEYDQPLLTDTIADRVFGQYGSFINVFPYPPSPDSLRLPGAVALDSNNNLYVATPTTTGCWSTSCRWPPLLRRRLQRRPRPSVRRLQLPKSLSHPMRFGPDTGIALSAGEVVKIGDVNGDRKPDLILANFRASSTVSVLLNTTPSGATTASFAAFQQFPTGASSNSPVTADVNGDGKPDVIVANSGDDTVSVLFNTTAPGAAMASFAPQQIFATEISPYFLAVRRRQARPHRGESGQRHRVGVAQHHHAVSCRLGVWAPTASAPVKTPREHTPTRDARRQSAERGNSPPFGFDRCSVRDAVQMLHWGAAYVSILENL